MLGTTPPEVFFREIATQDLDFSRAWPAPTRHEHPTGRRIGPCPRYESETADLDNRLAGNMAAR